MLRQWPSQQRHSQQHRGYKALEVGKAPFKSWTSPDLVFDQIDTDGSGTVDTAELSAFFRGRLDPDKLEAMFADLDEDGSGTVSREEWRKGYFDAGFGSTAMVGQSSEGLSVLLGLISPHYKVDFQDLTHRRPRARIPRVEERGITPVQLGELWTHLASRAEPEGWMDLEGQLVSAKTAAMYDVLRYVIKPATQRGECSYVEAVAAGPQMPLWCVSHWWGTPVREILDCLEQHARDRGIPDRSPYWISAFAVNQHTREAQVEDVVSAQSRVLNVTAGTVAVIDRGAVALKRTWVLYEMCSVLENMSLKLDVYTSRHHICVTTGRIDGTRHRPCTAVGLCDGFAMTDSRNFEANKISREAFFPVDVAIAALGVRLQESQASVERDRRALLNSLSGGVPSEQPPKEHARYEYCDGLLRARFAAAALRSVANASAALYVRCLHAMRISSPLKLQICLSRCKSFAQAEAQKLANALPPSVVDLDLGFHDVAGGCDFIKSFSNRLLQAGQFVERVSTENTPRSRPRPFGSAIERLGFKSNTMTLEVAQYLAKAVEKGCMPKLRELDFGMPVPFSHEVADELTRSAFVQSPVPRNFYGATQLASYVQLSHMKLTSSDLILLVASAASGGFTPLCSLDVSHNKICNHGLAALERALKPPLQRLPHLTMIDLSGNRDSTTRARMRVLTARREAADSNVEYALSKHSEFRIVAFRTGNAADDD